MQAIRGEPGKWYYSVKCLNCDGWLYLAEIDNAQTTDTRERVQARLQAEGVDCPSCPQERPARTTILHSIGAL